MQPYRRYVTAKSREKTKQDTPETHGSYGALLFDRRWKEKRVLILIRDLHKCVICGNSESLEVHHRQYHYLSVHRKFKAPWDYPDKILITLCNSCHQRGHAKFKVPIVNV